VADSTSDVRILKTEPLVAPDELARQIPATPAIAETVVSGRQQVQAVLAGEDPRLLLVMGPCSIHDEKAALEYGERFAALAEAVSDRMLLVMRVYFEKPRTTLGWKGLINDPHLDGSFDVAGGLALARRLLASLAAQGVHTATEFLDPIVPQYIADLVTWAAVGARTTESQIHREMASGLSMPVGFKNGTDGGYQIAIDAMKTSRAPHAFLGIDHQGRTCVVHTAGNPYGHLILRGGSRGTNFSAEAVGEVQGKLEAAGLSPRILVDCSHANSEKDHNRQAIAFRDVVAQRAAGNANIVGLMVESHLGAGRQDLGDDPSKLAYGVSITDACIDWDTTAALVHEAHEALAASPAPVR
jgi:3-deoxy-7-phosphoheptulonate synthase